MTPAPVLRARAGLARALELRQLSVVVCQEAHENLLAAVAASKPATFRLQETFRNADGSVESPHWDEHAEYRTQTMISEDELNDHLAYEGRWTTIGDPTDAEPRDVCRRVIDATWNTPDKDNT